MKKIFAVSDIHGEFDVLIDCLKRAGYDENNPDHLLISNGDEFDRGADSLKVYEYLKRLSDENKAIVLRGNHTNMFIDYLDGTSLSPFNYMRNGTNETFADFLGRTSPFESWCLIDKNIDNPTNEDFAQWLKEARDKINNNYPKLLDWLKSRPYYFETKNYIFTHASIDTNADDWHHPHCFLHNFTDWDALVWDDGSFFGRSIKNTDKTVVIGHYSTKHLRDMYGIPADSNIKIPESQDDIENNIKKNYSILKRDDGRVIAIDSTSNYTHMINVLVIESEDLLDE